MTKNLAMSSADQKIVLKLRASSVYPSKPSCSMVATKGLVESLTSLSFLGYTPGGYADIPRYMLEGLALSGMYTESEDLRDRTPAMKLGVNQLDLVVIKTFFRFVQKKGILGKLPGKSLDEILDILRALPMKYPSAAALRVTDADFDGLSDHDIDVNSKDDTVLFANSIPYLFKDCHRSLSDSAELIFMVGHRTSHAIRADASSRYYSTLKRIMDYLWEQNSYLTNAVQLDIPFGILWPRLRLPPLLVLTPDGVSAAREELERKLRWHLSPSSRDDEVEASLPDITFRLPTIRDLLKGIADRHSWLTMLQLCGVTLNIKTSAGGGVLFLLALEKRLKPQRDRILWLVNAGKTDSDLIEEVSKATVRAHASTASDEEDGEGGRDKRPANLAKVFISADDLSSVFNEPAFLTAAQQINELVSPEGIAKFPNAEERQNAVFDAISVPGLLVAWQRILRHGSLRSKHELLNQLTKFTGANLLTRIGYVIVVGPDKKRRRFAQSYSFPAQMHELFLGGKHAGIKWYVEGYLEAEKSIQQADSIPLDAQPFDFFASGDEYDAMGSYLHRVTMAYGYAANPIEGVSVVDFWKLLKEFRTLVREAPSADQSKMFELLIAFFSAGLEEAGPYLLLQLDETQPAGKQLQGYLPPSSLIGGVMHRMKEAMDGQLDIDNFRRKAPHLFVQEDRVVSSVRTASVFLSTSPAKRPREEEKTVEKAADEEKGDGKKLRAVGAAGKKVSYLDAEHNYIAIGKSVFGPCDVLAKECGVDRCWPVVLSSKESGDRCTMCPTPDAKGHGSRLGGAHAPAKLPKDWRTRFQHVRQGFQLPASGQVPTASAPK